MNQVTVRLDGITRLITERSTGKPFRCECDSNCFQRVSDPRVNIHPGEHLPSIELVAGVAGNENLVVVHEVKEGPDA